MKIKICLPLITPLSRLMCLTIAPPPATGLQGPQTHLDVQALQSPALALANATREVLSLADEVKLMLHNFWQAQTSQSKALAAQVHAHDAHVDDAATAVTAYLSRMSRQDLSDADIQWQFTLFSCVNELESIGDIIGKNLCDFVRKQAYRGFPMTTEDEYAHIKSRCDAAFSLLTTRDEKAARRFIGGEETLEEWCRQVQRDHYKRLRSANERTLQSSVFFLDMLSSFRRISGHLSTLAYAFVGEDAEGALPEASSQKRAKMSILASPQVVRPLPH